MNIYKVVDRQTHIDEATGETHHGKSVMNNFRQTGQDALTFVDLFDGAVSFREGAKTITGGIPVLSQIAQGVGGLIGFLVKDILFDGVRFAFGVPKNLVVDNVMHGVGAGVKAIRGDKDEPKPAPQPTEPTEPVMPRAENAAELEAQLQQARLRTQLTP